MNVTSPDGRRKTYQTAFERWEGLGPYYAMFPSWFADEVIREFTKSDEVVLDPFAGRGTSLFSAVKAGRYGVGAELSPVGWIYAKTKLHPASFSPVRRRLSEIATRAATRKPSRRELLPPFFQACFSPAALDFLIAARESLNWRTSSVDRTLMAHILVYLHGKRGGAFSNQMRQTKSMSPDYSVRWWAEKGLAPPIIDPEAFLARRLEWRYRHGRPATGAGSVVFGDSTQRLGLLKRFLVARGLGGAALLLTSPPYFGVTNYYYDQWLRLWLLGGAPRPQWNVDPHRNRFENAPAYKRLLLRSFTAAKGLMREDAVLYIRTSAAENSLDPLVTALSQVFPRHSFETMERAYQGVSQTQLFSGLAGTRLNEVDVLVMPPRRHEGAWRYPSIVQSPVTSDGRPIPLWSRRRTTVEPDG